MAKKEPIIENPTVEQAMHSPITFADLKTLVQEDVDLRFPYITKKYKNYYMYQGDRSAELSKTDEKWRSNLKSPITNMFQNKIHNQILNADRRYSATYTGTKFQDEDTATQATTEMIERADFIFSKDDTQSASNGAIFDAELLWRGISRLAYKYIKRDRKYLNKDGAGTKTATYKEDRPFLYYVSPYNFFIDRAATTKKNARFIIERRLLSDDMINVDYKIYGISITTDIKKKLDLAKSYVISKDYESIKKNIPIYNTDELRDIVDDDRFNIRNPLREVFEVHTLDTISIYINEEYMWTFAQLWPNPNFKYYITKFKENPWVMRSLGIGHVVEPVQDMYDKITNLRLDNVMLSVNKIFLTESDMNIFGNSKRMKAKPGDVIKVTDVNTFKTLEMWEIKESAYRETDVMFSLAQGTTWVSNYWLWMQNKVERVAGATDMMQETQDSQIKPLLDSIRTNMAEIMKDMLIYTLAYTDIDVIDKVLGPDNILKTLDVNDLVNDFEFDYNIDSNKKKYDAVTRTQYLDVLKITSWLVDVNGRPVVNLRGILEKVRDSLDLDSTTLLSPEDFEAQITSGETFKAMLQQKVQEEMAAKWAGQTPMLPWTGSAAGRPTEKSAQDTMIEWMRAQQTAGQGWVPANMTTNAAWVNW